MKSGPRRDYALALLPGEDAKAVVLHFVKPAGSGGRLNDERRLA
jgi:hypothetical protein